jgi:hypothetical protein
VIGGRWARCWTLRPDAPYWDGKSSGWLPEKDRPDASAEARPEATERLSKRFRLAARRRIKRAR